MKKVYFFSVIVLIIPFFGLSQNTRNTESPKATRYSEFEKDENKGFLFFKKKEKHTSTYEEEVVDFRKRVSEAYRKNAKEEIESQKKRYQDPTYFGHKRKPKKRKPGNQKFCKVCGIKH